MSPHTNSAPNVCVTSILCVPILPTSPVHVGLRIGMCAYICMYVCVCHCILSKHVLVIVFSGV